MRAPRCALLLLVLLQCVSSLPVTRSHLEQEDVKVIKCIVEVLADVLGKPPSLPVSQQCLETLRTDDRLVTVLRHRNFLQELQDIAGEGANERSEKRLEDTSDHVQDLQEPADQSMLMAVLTPGETLEERGAEEEKEHQSQENDIIASHEEDEKEEHAVMKKTENSDEEEEDEAGAAGAPDHRRVEEEEQEEPVERRRAGVGQQRDWSRSRETVHRRAYGQQEALHHSKEAWKSPEEEELQMMAGREPEERRDTEEGSATKKTEDTEMESLAVMENELENMAQKLHKLRHG
ncbi:hypothetical protein KOW79_019824 [Hemibagrus wyckioides]|uniref:Chromogranin-A n=1 Tax=Hemibagrus wyckioides TaxID=337641 RepID=A0A9D3N4M0_9TELE|nr:chromogranin-A isoform X2 [Hemibagrus wyckioides]KAG7316283.1 hypothetical protein KOW79_019824 [Hemibagrus wyckioides]